MLTTRNSGPEYSISLRPKTTIATKVLLVSMLAVVAFCLLAAPIQPVHASGGSLSIGTWSTPVSSTNCSGTNWYFYGSNNESCYTMTISCNNAQPLGLTFGYLSGRNH
jgi:hypothetical protein